MLTMRAMAASLITFKAGVILSLPRQDDRFEDQSPSPPLVVVVKAAQGA